MPSHAVLSCQNQSTESVTKVNRNGKEEGVDYHSLCLFYNQVTEVFCLNTFLTCHIVQLQYN